MIQTKIKKKYIKIRNLLQEREGVLSILFFIGGFLFDNLTLNRIDSTIDIIILLSWLFLSLFFIVIGNLGDYRGFKTKFMNKIYLFSVLIIQFAFGALFSAFVIFYTRSSSFFDSWPFLIILYFLFIVNEKFRKQYEKFHIQMSIFYFALLSFLIFYLPILFKEMNYWIFLLSILLSVILIRILLKYFFLYIPNLKKFKIKIIRNISIILIILNLLYFNQLLPPIPLSIKEIGIYHYVEKRNGKYYQVVDEKRNWYSLDNIFTVFHKQKKEKVYAYVSIFAPTGFKTEVRHVWYWFNETKNVWERRAVIPYKIIGGRDNGYRGRSYITNAKPGKWRLYVLAENGAVIGRKSFEIVEVDKVVDFDIIKKE